MCEILLQAKYGVLMRELMDAFHRKCDSFCVSLPYQWLGYIYREQGAAYFLSTGFIWFQGDDQEIQAVVDDLGGKDHLEDFFTVNSDDDDVWSHLVPCFDCWCYIWEKPALERELSLIYRQHNWGISPNGKDEKALPMSDATKKRVDWLIGEILKYTVPYTHAGECELASKKPTYHKDAIQLIRETFGKKHADNI